MPFSYYDNKHQVVGYSDDLTLKVVESIRAELKLAAITVRLVPVTSQNRIPLVVNGTVDLECGSTTHSTDRERKVDFSTTLFVVGTRLRRLPARASATSRTWPASPRRDRGHHLRAAAAQVQRGALRRHPDPGREGHGESFRALEAGRAAAFMMDDAPLYGERAKAARPGDWAVVGTPMSREAYACMMRKDDAAFKQAVDAALKRLMTLAMR